MKFDPYKQPFNSGQRPSLLNGITQFLKKPELLNRTVLVFVITYVLFLLTWLYTYLFAVPLRFGETDFRFFVKYLALPSSFDELMVMPWTIVTHFLIHTEFFKLLFYTLIISFFGKLFFDYWHNSRFIFLMILSVIAGAAVYVFLSALIPVMAESSSGSVLVGAGAFAFALMLYMFVHMPDHTFVYMMLVRVKMKYVVLAVVIIDLLFYNSTNPGIQISHLGGAIIGAGFALLSKAFKVRRFSKPKMKVSHPRKVKSEHPLQTKTDEEYNLIRKQKQEKMDAILDKISRSGYGSLTDEEKNFLFYESKR